MTSISNPCHSCAYSEGSDANLEPNNNIKAQACALGGIPFWCHQSIEWENPASHQVKDNAEFRARGQKICEGWRARVAQLADAGYFRERREFKRAWAALIIENLQFFLGADDELEKKDALEAMMKYLRLLQRYAAPFQANEKGI